MAKKRSTSSVVWLRRVVQTSFLLLFFYLFLQTTFHAEPQPGQDFTFFFEFDPLVLLVTWLGSSAVPRILLLSLCVVGLTLIAGRWFCGWLCPFGTLHNVFTGFRKGSVKVKLNKGGYSGYQR